MDLSTLKSLFSTPTLADYLPGGSKSATAANGAGSSALSLLDGTQGTNGDGSGDSVDLSSAAQQLLAIINGQTSTASTSGASGSSSPTDDQQAAQNTITGFFTGNGVDTSKLSADAQKLLQGFQDVINNSGATTRDTKTDSMEEQYQGANHKVFTLTGNNTRLRIAIDYAAGKPQIMTITDINGSSLETANITLTNDAGGAPSGIQITRSQSQYLNGAMVSSTAPSPRSVALYQS